jgi:hypothetical protein
LCCPRRREIWAYYTDFSRSKLKRSKKGPEPVPGVTISSHFGRVEADRERGARLHEKTGGQGSASGAVGCGKRRLRRRARPSAATPHGLRIRLAALLERSAES